MVSGFGFRKRIGVQDLLLGWWPTKIQDKFPLLVSSTPVSSIIVMISEFFWHEKQNELFKIFFLSSMWIHMYNLTNPNVTFILYYSS